MPSYVQHFEIPADDLARAQAFYKTVFGFNYEPWGDEMGMLVRDGTEEGIDGDLHKRDDVVPHPTITVTVDDLDTTLALVLANGGSQLNEIQPLTHTSRWVYVRDSEGNAIGIHDLHPVKPTA